LPNFNKASHISSLKGYAVAISACETVPRNILLFIKKHKSSGKSARLYLPLISLFKNKLSNSFNLMDITNLTKENARTVYLFRADERAKEIIRLVLFYCKKEEVNPLLKWNIVIIKRTKPL